MESNKQIIVLVALFMCVAIAQAKVYKKCELARELSDKHKFSRTLLPSWICMVESESGFNTKKVAPYPPIPGSHPPIHQSYGIFQINSKTYCGKGYVGGKCKVRCEDLLSDDITKSAQCAQIVLNTEGFKAWRGWEQKCKKSIPELPPLKECWRAAVIAG